jgi:hypothetical protein
LDNGLFVTARLGDDMTVVHSSWNEGIESWRFQLPMEYNPSLIAAHTIFDRSLFRAGETVHMKHVLRKHLTSGFGLLPEGKSPTSVRIQHLGSDQKYDLPLHWDAHGIAESTWIIPKGAKLGQYQVLLETSVLPVGTSQLSTRATGVSWPQNSNSTTALPATPEPARRAGGPRFVYKRHGFTNVRVGAGGPALTFDTLNGDVRILRAGR